MEDEWIWVLPWLVIACENAVHSVARVQFDEKEESMPAEVLQEGEENGQEEAYSDNERSTRARPYSSKPAYQGQRAQMQAHLSNAAYQEQMIDPSLKGVENLITSMKNDH